MEAFTILHIDDDDEALNDFKNVLAPKRKPSFSIISVQSANQALQTLLERDDINLCMVDWELDQTHPKTADTWRETPTWNGLSFVSAAKDLSPSTSFIMLTSSSLTRELKTAAARVGCFNVIGKRELLDKSKRPAQIKLIEYACMYSRHFLVEKSDARLNFSQSIAHNLHGTLLRKRHHLDEARQNLSLIETSSSEKKEHALSALKSLEDMYADVTNRLNRVLEFYSKNELQPESANIYSLVQEAVCTKGVDGWAEVVCSNTMLDGMFDYQLVKLAVMNLIDNSIKATAFKPKQEQQMLISIEVESIPSGKSGQTNELFKVVVMDNGVGLHEGTEDKILQPGVSYDNLGKVAASFGIGSAEAAKVARLHRNGNVSGSLKYENRTDCSGCIATFRIPTRSIIVTAFNQETQ